MNDNIPGEIDFVCDRVRFAKFSGEELDEQMKEHLSQCDKCRTFFEQSSLMERELGALGVDTLIRNGKSVADSVMEEISRQEMFTKGNTAKASKGVFKHFGLIAACVIIAVMALPVMDNVFGTKNQNIQFAKDMAADDAGIAPAEIYGAGGTVSFENYSYALNGAVETESEEVCLDDAVDGVDYNAANTEAYSDGTALNEPVIYKARPKADADFDDNEIYEAEMSLFEVYENGTVAISGELEEAAFMGALDYLGNGTRPVRDSVVLTFAGDNIAYAVFETDKGDKITVCLEKSEDLWIVGHVCDGDITE